MELSKYNHTTLPHQPIVALSAISVPFSSVTQSCPILCHPMNRSTPGLPVHHLLFYKHTGTMLNAFIKCGNRLLLQQRSGHQAGVQRCHHLNIFNTCVCVCVCVCVCTLSYLVMSDSVQLHGLQPARLLCPWNFPGSGLPFHTPGNNSQPRD